MGRVVLTLMLLATASLSSQTLEPFDDTTTGLWGFKDAKGRVVIPAMFQHAYEFHGRVAAVLADDGWKFVDRKGKVQLFRPFIYDNGPDYYEDGLCRFVQDGKVGFLDEKGLVAIEPMAWDFVNSFSDGRAVVCNGCRLDPTDEHGGWKGGTWGFIDKRGKVVIAPTYDMALPFDDGEARVMRDGEWIVIDKYGNRIE